MWPTPKMINTTVLYSFPFDLLYLFLFTCGKYRRWMLFIYIFHKFKRNFSIFLELFNSKFSDRDKRVSSVWTMNGELNETYKLVQFNCVLFWFNLLLQTAVRWVLSIRHCMNSCQLLSNFEFIEIFELKNLTCHVSKRDQQKVCT